MNAFVRPFSLHRLARPLLVGLALLAAACQSPTPLPPELRGSTMGTTYSIKLSAAPSTISLEDLHLEVDAILEQVNAQMSTYRPDSELSRFNDAPAKTPVTEVSTPLLDVVELALQVHGQTEGAFDITAGPLVNLWSFGPEGGPDRVPTDAEISEAMASTGVEHLTVDRQTPALSKAVAGVYVDLSGVAKGHAVDLVAERLEHHGLTDYFVDIGGEVRIGGTKADGSAWRLAIEAPIAGVRQIQQVLELKDVSIATSGDYRNFFEVDGVRYSHIIDPRTGKPIRHGLASVSVFRPACAEADAYATGLLVLGVDEALRVAESHGLAILLIERDGDDVREHRSSAFEAMLASMSGPAAGGSAASGGNR